MSSEDPHAQWNRFSIGTWNMDHWKRHRLKREKAWEYLRTQSNTDVMLLQECVVPSGLNLEFVYREIAGYRPWGSSVVAFSEGTSVQEIDAVRTRYGAKRFSMLGTFPGSVIVAQANLPDIGPITCVSIYGLTDVYAQTTMLRIVADLIPLFDSRFGSRVVLGGDFNITTACKKETPELPRYEAILNAVESLGLMNLATTAMDRPPQISDCPCSEDKCFHIRTYQKSQLDWLYATPELARRCTKLRVDYEVVDGLSDHAPIIAEFQLPPLEPVVEDPESFIEEMKYIAGSENAQSVEDLIDWALRKHGELQASRYQVSYDRLPVEIRQGKPQIWFQLDYRYRSIIQWTFSVIADGQVVVNFQHMVAPYDTTEAREQLWSALNQIEGVSVEKKLNGHPKFSLQTLVAPERLEQFIKVFSDMIDATVRHLTTGNLPVH
ncbi:MAG: endonuclease/exonuclease/phosphatase family protein [Rhodothermaceae bacterium]|nr:endonuclease/exonuclease/phosphatase family protein [Rhodothermaceae bacterium]MYG69417.1 endonuclease/exonuclease/phosphatase family protein [Rhodothermaceae bacterium]MYJ44594.1 endonuclease/exonuclease/phosphatase family protein [Rhodothermaceae bacterium]